MAEKMNPAQKAEWVAALRSGEYKQAQNHLHTPHGFCCLGVLCDVIKPDAWELIGSGNYAHAGWENVLSDDMRRFAALPDAPLNVLMSMNDRGRSFSEIADYIEEHL